MAAPQIHPSAFVAPTAQLGDDVIVGPCAVIEDDVVIGARTRIDAFASVKRYTTMGEDNHIYSYAAVGGEPQDLKFHGEKSQLIIGNRNRIREFTTLHRGTEAGGGVTRVGDNNLLMAYVHIAHDCKLGNNIIISNSSQIAGEVVIDDYAILSGGVLCHQFTHIGSHVMIQGGSQVNKDIPPYAKIGHTPIAFAGINTVGLRRRGFSDEAIAVIQEVYRCIYMAGMNTSDALKYIEENVAATPERDEILQFVHSSERGIVRGLK